MCSIKGVLRITQTIFHASNAAGTLIRSTSIVRLGCAFRQAVCGLHKGHCQDHLTSLVSDLNGNLFPSHVGRQVTPEFLNCFQSFGVSRL
jgi:hypothetical protein